MDVGMWPDECQRQPSAMHDAKVCTRAECKRSAWSEDYAEAGTHREFARSGDANDGEGAEVDSVLPRRRHLARHRVVLLGLGLVLRLVLGRLGVRPSVVLVLDLERIIYFRERGNEGKKRIDTLKPSKRSMRGRPP